MLGAGPSRLRFDTISLRDDRPTAKSAARKAPHYRAVASPQLAWRLGRGPFPHLRSLRRCCRVGKIACVISQRIARAILPTRRYTANAWATARHTSSFRGTRLRAVCPPYRCRASAQLTAVFTSAYRVPPVNVAGRTVGAGRQPEKRSKAVAGRTASTAPARENSCKASTRASGSPTQPDVPMSGAPQT